MNVLITGGGVVGTYTARAAEEKGLTPTIFELKPDYQSIKNVWKNPQVIVGDVTDKENFQKTVAEFNPNVIIHTAALRQRMAKADPARAKLVNIYGTQNIVDAASSKNIPLIYISSDTIYGTLLEENKSINEDTLLDPKTIYAETKVKAEEIVKKYEGSIILRSTSLYGPWVGNASTFNEIIRDIIKAGLENKDFEMEIPVAKKSEQLYVRDLAKAIINSIDNKSLNHKIFNIGAGELISYEDVEQSARDLFGINVKLTDADLGKERVQSVRSKPLDIRRAKEELGYIPDYSFDKAFKEYAEIVKSWKK